MPLGSDVARCHGIHAHAAARPFQRGGLGEAHHARARRAAVAHAGHGAPHVGHDVDDGATVRLHALHVALARHQEAAGEVGVEHRLPALGADVLQRRDVLAAGVVHQAVDAPMRADDGGHHGAHRRLPGGCRRRGSWRARRRRRFRQPRPAACRALRPISTTCAPRLASSCAVQRPMPEPPPVITTTRPCMRPGAKADR